LKQKQTVHFSTRIVFLVSHWMKRRPFYELSPQEQAAAAAASAAAANVDYSEMTSSTGRNAK
jgi:hypothetical protein